MYMMIRCLLVILLKLILADCICGQNNCDSGSCYPAIGDLLVGRSKQLTASSTCGQFGPQKYCIIGYLEDKQKCFTCDSRYPYHPVSQTNSHLIENVITTFEPHRKKWWQSENGIDHVSIRLDLESLFQFSHLILTFKTFRPAAMLVELSVDYGQTWKLLRYFAQDCATSFPDIPSRPAREVGEVVCDSRYSDIEPSTEGEVVFKALDPNFEIQNPYAPDIQALITFTNLRINFTKLHTLGDILLGQKQPDPLEKYYYALYEMVVRGSCFCNGHASYCSPVQNLRGDIFHEPEMVHGTCLCKHDTDGSSCERCKEFFNDVPWRPADGSQENACKKCECHGHSKRCHFDMAVYLSNNRTSGGVCDGCQHNTMGQHCDRCMLFFYHDPQKTISDPHACIPCDCNPEGTRYSGLCESQTDLILGTIAGRCCCKENVEGLQCDKCKPNCYGLNRTDPLGCQPCNCHPSGSLPFSICSPVTGECLCQKFVMGQHCNECIPGYWGLGSNLHGCSSCNCDIGGALNNLCEATSGKCACLPNIEGRQCTEPAPGYFFLPLDYYIYEAENAKPLPGYSPLSQYTALPRCDVYFRQQGYHFAIENGKIILNKSKKQGIRKVSITQDSVLFGRDTVLDIVIRELIPGKTVTWSGPGFVRVLSGTGLSFTINNIPFAMEFNIIIRYEPESLEDWVANIFVKSSNITGSEQCKNTAALQEPHSLLLPSTARIELLPTPFCLEPGSEYFVDIYFSKLSASDPQAPPAMLIDSLGLIPRIGSVENLCNKEDLEEYQQYHCVEIASELGPHILPEVCAKLIASLSARIHNGAVSCRCHPQGSMSTDCKKLEGQCQCKPNVVGRCCDKCSAGSHSFGPQGCHPCECHPKGSVSALCDQRTGQCSCRFEVDGQQCNRCLAGYFGFPHCRPCPCNSFAELCDAQTGACLNCKEFTTGANCERCIDGYYGNPLKREPCRPCMCPSSPSSNRYFAHSCYQDLSTSLLVCSCLKGYTGDRCEECPNGFDTDPKATEECDCNPLGVDPAECPSGIGFCICDQTTGTCPCLPNVIGSKCDQCASGYWDLAQGTGCSICDCDPEHSQNSLCDQFTGQCSCKIGYSGRRCDVCDENYFGDPQIHCIPCKCTQDGTLKPECDKDTGLCNCCAGITGRFCHQCARGYHQEFPSCLHCHVCFDQWDNIIVSLSQRIKKLMNFASTYEDKRNIMPGCDIDLKGYEDTFFEIERIFKSLNLSSEMFLNIKNFHEYIRQEISQLYLQSESMDQFSDFNWVIEDLRKDADHLLEFLQKKFELHHSISYIHHQDSLNKIWNSYQTTLSSGERTTRIKSIINDSGKTRDVILAMLDDLVSKENTKLDKMKMFEIADIQNLSEKVKNIRKMTEDTKRKASQVNEELEISKHQIEVQGKSIKELIKRVKYFLMEESGPPEDIENVANYVLGINLTVTPQELTITLDKLKSLLTSCENSATFTETLNSQMAVDLLIKAQETEELSSGLPGPDELINRLKEVENIQGQTKQDFAILNGTIEETIAKISQVGNQLNQADAELRSFSEKQSKLENEVTSLKMKMQMNRDQATHAKSEADKAQHQSLATNEDFANLKKKYTNFQENLKAKGFPLEKLNRLKKKAEKLSEETERKMKRISDLEKKIQDLNQIKQKKADQLKQLEDQVIAIKNEITEQSHKYATCKS
ncbi:laminin subunit beta-4 isoform X2 [Sphaerodactylus townsendi]|uniref:laminin subunit beta-4 isoform X2 n=1 Tax=Sphaerodactylus townsendi TaxID=933632 RepID=UPI0020264BEC|nr:laminin subunit beta-4 isoform X2 [Sphaerodactylus townsendi]